MLLQSKIILRAGRGRPEDKQPFLLLPEEVRAASDRVVVEVFGRLLAAVVLARVGPDQVAHGPERWRLLKPV